MTTSAHNKLKRKLCIFNQEVEGNCKTETNDKYSKPYTTSLIHEPADSTEVYANAHEEQAVIRHITVLCRWVGDRAVAEQCQQETKQHTL